jgi:hypothetical protein
LACRQQIELDEIRLMRSRVSSLPRPVLAGLLVFLTAFAFFSFTTQELTGYEPETGAVAEGFVREGHFWDVENSPLPLKAGYPGRGGHHYALSGLLQTLGQVPFLAAGHLIDVNFGWFGNYPFGYVFLWFYNPFVAAIAAAALFALIYMTRRSIGWATATAALFAVASIAWPYSKIGMETTFMAAVLVAFALAVWARRRPTIATWGLTGLAGGAALANKPYAAIALVSIGVLLWPTFRALDRRRRTQLALAACLPLLAWLAAIGWYNWFRFGSPVDSGYHESMLTLAMPLNVFGLLLSPGKGLVFYSPLVVLGALGLPRLWRQDRSLTVALLVFFVGLLCVAGAPIFWGDEVWGPRYLVPAAWVLLVPIAWWADSALRRKVLLGVASVAVLVQVVGVSTQYAQYTDAVRALSGVPVYRDRLGVSREKIPYGDDPTRWVPELSALLVQGEGLVSSQIVERLGGHGLEITYAPFEGRSRTLNFGDPRFKMPLNFWWYLPGGGQKWLVRFIALLMLIAAMISGSALYRVTVGAWSWRGRSVPVAE